MNVSNFFMNQESMAFRMYDLDEACSLLEENGFQIVEKFEKQEPE